MKSTVKWCVAYAARKIARAARSHRWSTAAIAFPGLAVAGCGGVSPLLQQQSRVNIHNIGYTIQDLGVVGANPSQPGQPLVISNSGWVSGSAGIGAAEHAALWYGGKMIDIGIPGLGGNSMAYGVNESGMAAGEAEMIAPALSTTEDFCGFQAMGYSSSPIPCVPFIWQNGQMIPLPTLGGVNGEATEINSSGAVAGYAENTTLDPNCTAPQKYQFKPVVWSDKTVQVLPTGNDANGVAWAINDVGQVAGASGTCAPFNPISLFYLNPIHALLWQNGIATDLGNLGGTFNNIAHGINNLGQVVGQSDLAGDETSHAFMWSASTKMQDLGTVAGDFFSIGLGINDGGQIVGVSANADFSVIRAWIRQNGALVDVNSLVVGNNSLYLMTACSVNAQGQIIGIAIDPNTFATHGYLATPTTLQASAARSNESKSVILPVWMRTRLASALRYSR